MTTVSEMEVEASAGPGAWNDEFVHEKGRWSLPEGMIRHEGDRLVVDTARPVREPPRKAKAPMLRLLSANPDYPPYTRLACDIHIVGKVLWKVTRAKRAGAARRGGGDRNADGRGERIPRPSPPDRAAQHQAVLRRVVVVGSLIARAFEAERHVRRNLPARAAVGKQEPRMAPVAHPHQAAASPVSHCRWA